MLPALFQARPRRRPHVPEHEVPRHQRDHLIRRTLQQSIRHKAGHSPRTNLSHNPYGGLKPRLQDQPQPSTAPSPKKWALHLRRLHSSILRNAFVRRSQHVRSSQGSGISTLISFLAMKYRLKLVIVTPLTSLALGSRQGSRRGSRGN